MSASGSAAANLATPLLPAAAIPVVWSVLGNSFPAGSMVVALFAAVLVRAFRTFSEKSPRIRAIDLIVTAIVTLTTAVWVIKMQPDLFAALGSGLGFGAAGEGIVLRGPAIWDAITGKGGTALAKPPATPDVPADMTAMLEELEKHD